MNYLLENENLKVEISDIGAEVQSIKGKKSGFEYLWQGNPEFWSSRSTVIFPVCGRLVNGQYTYKGKTYDMIIHGFAKKQTFKVTENDKNEIKFTLTANEETKKSYPFDFVLDMVYTLENSKLVVTFNVKNTNDCELPFSLGGHPGFNVPLLDKGDFTDCYIEFEKENKPERITFAPSYLYSGKNVFFPLENDKILRLKHELFDDDAIFLTKTCKKVTLKSTKCDAEVRVSFGDMNYLGFWHKPQTEAPYVCIEPWHGIPATDGVMDDLESKNEIIKLPKGQTYSTYFDIEIKE